VTTNNKKKKFVYTCVVVPVAVANGMIGGITSVITAYFFKPIWDRTIKWWKNERKID
jgi:hypothetical protein